MITLSPVAKKGFVLGTFLDIEGSFDNISFNAITHPTTAGWITNMLTNRFVTITSLQPGESDSREVAHRVTSFPPFSGTLVLTTYSAEHILGYLQALKTFTTIIENWCHNKGLNINALKNKLVMFT